MRTNGELKAAVGHFFSSEKDRMDAIRRASSIERTVFEGTELIMIHMFNTA